mgnify:CR=1 FL=1
MNIYIFRISTFIIGNHNKNHILSLQSEILNTSTYANYLDLSNKLDDAKTDLVNKTVNGDIIVNIDSTSSIDSFNWNFFPIGVLKFLR